MLQDELRVVWHRDRATVTQDDDVRALLAGGFGIVATRGKHSSKGQPPFWAPIEPLVVRPM